MAPGLTTRSKDATFGAPGLTTRTFGLLLLGARITTRNKDATRGSWPYY